VSGEGGNDTIDASALAADAVHLVVDGGAGDDTILSGHGNDLLAGGTGDDTFVWNPGDGSDTVDGGAGHDTLVFAGSAIGESMDISANAAHVRLSRDVGGVAMDLAGIETIEVKALAGADTVVVNDLAGTDTTRVDIDLAATGGASDGVADAVVVNGTVNADSIVARSVGGETVVSGLAAEVHVSGSDAGLDTLQINGGQGSDTIDASGVDAGGPALSINGGVGDDTITGSAGSDFVTGGTGNDVALLGAGNDTFVWNPGDASDLVDGQDGSDRLVFNGANIVENLDVSANGDHIRLTRDVGNVTMDVHGVETIDLAARAAAPTGSSCTTSPARTRRSSTSTSAPRAAAATAPTT
jgi:Ca2+-binding RTX toxin-like protein